MMNRSMMLILDFGGDQAQSMARMLRGAGVYCRIMPYQTDADTVRQLNPSGILMLGGRDDRELECDYGIWLLRTPVLAIGSSCRYMIRQLGGHILRGELSNEMTRLEIDSSCPIFDGLFDCERYIRRMNALDLPETFRAAAQAGGMAAAVAYEKKRLFGLQFDIEANDPEGLTILNNFINDVCTCERWWSIPTFIAEKIEEIREQVGAGHALMALSGGVDSSVCAVMMHHAVGKQLHCIYVDTGLMRKGDAEMVKRVFSDAMGIQLTMVDAKARFLSRLAGVSDPKEKFRIISEEFADIYESEAARLPSVDCLIEGTIYSDVLKGHDLGYMPVNEQGSALSDKPLIEPVRDLFKEEVRAIGEVLGLPAEIVERQSFPGAGLGSRIIGEITEENLRLLREADSIWNEEISASGLHRRIQRYSAVLSETTSTGRAHCERVIALRAQNRSGMGHAPLRLPYDLLERASERILRELPKIDRVVYDLTPSPLRPLDWE